MTKPIVLLKKLFNFIELLIEFEFWRIYYFKFILELILITKQIKIFYKINS